MTTRPIRPRRLAAIAAVTFALTGCQDSRLQKELTRFEGQLEQADKRLQIATVQVEAANAQVAGLKQSLEQSQAEAEKVRQAAAEELVTAQKNAEMKRREVEQEKVAALTQLDNARRALAVAQSRLDQIAKEEAKKKEVFAPLGVWELTVDGERYRFSFHDDGAVVVKTQSASGFWVTANESRGDGRFRRLKSHYRFRHLEDNKFELADYLKKDEHAGRFLVRSEKDASIWFDDGPDLFRDDFDKPKWLNVKKIAEASAPGEHAQ